MQTLLLVAFALFAGLLMTRLFVKFHLPDVTAYLVTGVLIGPCVLGRLGIPGLGFRTFEEVESLNLISDVALGFIAFAIGHEFRMSALKQTGRQATIIGILQAVTATVLGEEAKVPPIIEKLVAPVAAKNQSMLTPEVFVSRANKRLQFPTCPPDEVRLVPYDSLFGLSAKVLIIVGFVNGFVPKHDFFDRTQLIADKREKRRVEDLKRAARVFSSATERILISTFALVDMEVADRSRIVMDRIGLVDGKPMSYTQPSVLLEKL